MVKNICFFCDISGTIDGRVPNKVADYEEFNRLLLCLKEKIGVDFILFSLISTDTQQAVMREQKILSMYFDPSIIFGRQFFDEGYFEKGSVVYGHGAGKTYQMTDYIKTLEESSLVEGIFYADDCDFFHNVLALVCNDKTWYSKLYSIAPKEKNGLSELNKLISVELNVLDSSFSKLRGQNPDDN